MNERQVKLVIGSLLHDIGKITYRSGDGRNHSQSGYEFLKNEAALTDGDILDCVRYHHAFYLKNAPVADDALAYITYFADNVASAADRRKKDDPEDGFDKSVPLASVFNILNGNTGNLHYEKRLLNIDEGVNVPTEKTGALDETFYQAIIRQITENLRGIRYTDDYINSLLTILEADTTYIPSSTSRRELEDISLYDHVKMTAALATALEQTLSARNITDFKEALFHNAEKAYQEKWFLLYSLDISGIQKFIYSIGSEGALKGLRARSFYLEILMEHIIDELLTENNLTRANLIYSGGGHCYLLLPNTEEAKEKAEKWIREVNSWLMDRFDTALYVASGCAACSADNLQNKPEGSYPELFREMSRMISGRKAHRYSASDIVYLNHKKDKGERECRICRRMEPLNAGRKCAICAALEDTSKDVLYSNYFAVMQKSPNHELPLPGGCVIRAVSDVELTELMSDDSYVRSYTKNKPYTGVHVTTTLLVGSYTAGMTFEEFASAARGIKRLGVLRADVDNLGSAIVSGFPDKYASLSRTATFSRQLSLFFKGYINYILEHGTSDYFSAGGKRNAAIVYSGGDDLFLVGAWNEILDAFIDIRNELRRFTEGTLKLSGGVGLYPGRYPIHLMATETERLENASKDVNGKNAITVFDTSESFPWQIFMDNVVKEKYGALEAFFSTPTDRGTAFLYHLLELIRDSGEKIQFARYVYLLSRLEPDRQSSEAEQEIYRNFADHMVRWYQTPDDRKSLITAIYLFVYTTRGRKNESV